MTGSDTKKTGTICQVSTLSWNGQVSMHCRGSLPSGLVKLQAALIIWIGSMSPVYPDGKFRKERPHVYLNYEHDSMVKTYRTYLGGKFESEKVAYRDGKLDTRWEPKGCCPSGKFRNGKVEEQITVFKLCDAAGYPAYTHASYSAAPSLKSCWKWS